MTSSCGNIFVLFYSIHVENALLVDIKCMEKFTKSDIVGNQNY